MNKFFAFCILLLLPVTAHAAPSAGTNGRLNWSMRTTWTLDVKPLDFVQSLDNRKVFVLGSDARVHVYTQDGTLLGSIPVDKNTTAIDIAPRGETLYLINDRDNTYTALDVGVIQSIDITGAPVMGREDAPVTLVIFSDFQCPYCSKVQPLLKQVLDHNRDTLKIVFKHLPLPMHNEAEPAALAAIAAQNQGKFWQMHDALFAAKPLTPEKIDQAARQIGLDMARFKKDMNSPETRQKLARDMMDARKADVSGTPTLFINGRRVTNRSEQAIQQMIDQEVRKAGSADKSEKK
ncbi:MAG TPA: disulfide bond formation protein DsbA [Desulfobulbus sp.]|nr:disulfide bond formation protein DsbA [Desulfobulbus sp.]